MLNKSVNMNLSQQEWAEKLANDDNAVILDVRTEDEVNEGIIPGAINIDIYEGQGFIYKVEELDKSKNYYVYCKAGSRSQQACNIMSQLGFENTYNLMGGFSQWTGDVSSSK
jgi:rhodanese-related sulfurtransferase